jgi:hypothetical protein
MKTSRKRTSDGVQRPAVLLRGGTGPLTRPSGTLSPGGGEGIATAARGLFKPLSPLETVRLLVKRRGER